MKQLPIDKILINPIKRFMNNTAMSGVVLFSAVFVALVIANSPWAEGFNAFWEIEFSVGFGESVISKSLHHWINDGLMAVFFFVVGLELKREIIGGELSQPKNAVLPLVSALGGMLVPALLYFAINSSGEASNGWGIPMATDIAFALGILYLLGDKVPLSLKIFLTALAIADDLGAVLVIAIFYTSEIDWSSLIAGGIFMIVLIVSNVMGVRNTLYYAIIGIGGVWLAFLMSGVHATIAAVLAAFTIPANVKIGERAFSERLNLLLEKFRATEPNNVPTVTPRQSYLLESIRNTTKHALTPLQRLEHAMHPLVVFVIMPIFALSNAGVDLSGDLATQVQSPVTIGIMVGLIFGKVFGVVGFAYVMIKLKWAALPEGMNMRHLVGAGFLAAIGFTMSLFISDLAFVTPELEAQAKLGILVASVFSGLIGFLIIRWANKKAST